MPGRAPLDVVVVGAGLAGLRSAAVLQEHGLDVAVLDAADHVGGRVRTDVVDGLTLDRGFQLLNPAYPEARRALDLDALELRPFVAGLCVAHGDGRTRIGDPRRVPPWSWGGLFAPLGPAASRLRLARYAWACSRATPAELRRRPEATTRDALHDAGVDEVVVDQLVRPFLAGVLLDDELTTSRRFSDLVLRSFVRGTPAVPASGMAAIPEQLAAGLAPGTVRLGVAVRSIGSGRVVTDDGELGPRAVVVAVGGHDAPALLPGLPRVRTRALTTWYHLADCDADALHDGRAVLATDADRRGPLVNSVALTAAAPEYATGGRVLVASSAIGLRPSVDDEQEARAHLAVLHGVDASGWEHVATRPVEHALPSMAVPLDLRREVRLGDGLYVCGDHRDTASIQGALVSGRRTAEAVLFDLTSG